jgi:ABC-2 type transport system ATP-binding protein
MGPPRIRAERLTRTFGDRTAVAGLDLEVGAGEIFGLLGPNGAGKSTTVRMLTTLLRPTSGAAWIAGFDVVRERTAVRRVSGAALQETSVDPLMTGAELMRLQAALYALPRAVARRRVPELLDRFGLGAVAGRRVQTYSGGMRRRLDLALALIHEPQVLFLDEPTTGIDPISRMAVWDEIRALSRENGTTVLLTTQYLEEADRLCRRVAIIDGGAIVRHGPVADLKAEVDTPTLRVSVPDDDRETAARILAGFGPPRADGGLAIGLTGGPAATAAVVRALDEKGITLEHLQLDAPSLDDVLADATGRRLEGASSP